MGRHHRLHIGPDWFGQVMPVKGDKRFPNCFNFPVAKPISVFALANDVDKSAIVWVFWCSP
jgi:hypothetical protein